MKLADKVIVVTGGANGIGRALCRRFALESPRGIVVADLDFEKANLVADEIGGLAIACDVAQEEQIQQLVADTESKYGPIDLFCANAGILSPGGFELSDDQWRQMFDVNVMAHVYSARAVVPGMLARGSGYLLHTASAAGLLTAIGAAAYAASKHAALSFAEWLAVTYGDQGLKVSCLCPMGVWTDMLVGDHPEAKTLQASAVQPSAVADLVVESIEAEKFLILPHPEVQKFFQNKASDYDRWLRGMKRLRAEMFAGEPQA